MKDQDIKFLLNFKDFDLINVSLLDKRKIMFSIKSDIDFLASHNIMDYSLLLIVEDKQTHTLRNVSQVDM